MRFDNMTPEAIVALIVGLGIYFSAISAVYVGFGPPAKKKAMLRKKQEEKLKMEKETMERSGPPKDEDSIKEILDSLKKEKDRTLGNIKNLDEDIRSHEERLRKLEEDKKTKE